MKYIKLFEEIDFDDFDWEEEEPNEINDGDILIFNYYDSVLIGKIQSYNIRLLQDDMAFGIISPISLITKYGINGIISNKKISEVKNGLRIRLCGVEKYTRWDELLKQRIIDENEIKFLTKDNFESLKNLVKK